MGSPASLPAYRPPGKAAFPCSGKLYVMPLGSPAWDRRHPCRHTGRLGRRRSQASCQHAGSLLVTAVTAPRIRAAESPLLRRTHKPGLHRVILDVFDSRFQVPLISDEPVIVLPLPECATSTQQSVCLICCERLPGVKHCCQWKAGQKFKQHMHVVRHHAPCNQTVACSVEMKQCLLNHLCHA